MLELALTAITVVYLAIASFTDLRQRIVPDWLSYLMIAIGIAVHAVLWLFFGQAQAFTNMALALAVSLALSLLLWKIGFWAGGDVKLFTAVAALNPVNYAVLGKMLGLNSGIFGTIELPVFPITLFVFSVYSLFPMGLLITARKITRNSSAKNSLQKELKESAKKMLFFSLLAAGVAAIVSHYSIHPLAGLAVVLIAVFFAKKFFNAFSVIVFAAGIATGQSVFTNAVGVFVAGVLIALLFRLVRLNQSDALRDKVAVKNLVEGMIPAVTLVEKDGKIERHSVSIKSILKHLKENNVAGLMELVKPQGRVIVSSASADGLEKNQIEELKGLAEKGLIEKEFMVKESTAFVPAVLAGYLLLSVFGDILWNVFL